MEHEQGGIIINMPDFWAGKKEVFKEIVQYWAARLDEFSKENISDTALREEIIAEAFYRLFHDRSSCKTKEEIGSFLFTCVAIQCLERGMALDNLPTRCVDLTSTGAAG